MGRAGPPTERRGEAGFTLIELLVVLLTLGILLGLALPTFAGMRRGAQDAAAKSTLSVAERMARTVAIELGTFPKNKDLLVLLPSLEPSISWLDQKDSSTGPGEVSIDEGTKGTELDLAVRSESGTCFYLRVVVNAPPARHAVEGAKRCEAHDYQGGPDTGW